MGKAKNNMLKDSAIRAAGAKSYHVASERSKWSELIVASYVPKGMKRTDYSQLTEIILDGLQGQ